MESEEPFFVTFVFFLVSMIVFLWKETGNRRGRRGVICGRAGVHGGAWIGAVIDGRIDSEDGRKASFLFPIYTSVFVVS